MYSIFQNVKEAVHVVQRHVKILRELYENGTKGMPTLAKGLGLELHEVRYSLTALQKAGLVRMSYRGAQVLNINYEKLTKEIDEIIRELQEVKKLIPQPSKKKR
jgi:predicted transcriptional regulator